MRIWFRVFAVLLVFLTLTSCSVLYSQTDEIRAVSDKEMLDELNDLFSKGPYVSTEKIYVDVNRGNIYLVGNVSSLEAKIRFEQLAWRCRGVNAVINNLQVKSRRAD